MTNKVKETMEHSFEIYKNNIAIDSEKGSISYLDLKEKTEMIMNEIETPDSPLKIAVYISNVEDVVSALIACIRMNAVFILLERVKPFSRTENIINDVECNLMITDDEGFMEMKECRSKNGYRLLQKEHFSNLHFLKFENERDRDLDSDCAYIYYTSGTTGNPNGIVGTYSGLHNFIQWEVKTFEMNESFRVSQCTSVSFDPFLRDILVPLYIGGKIVIPKTGTIQHIKKFPQWLAKEKISVLHTVPALFREIAWNQCTYKELSLLKYIFIAGEILDVQTIKRFRENSELDHIQLINLYGPTETILAKFYHIVSENDMKENIIPVGKPIDENTYFDIKKDHEEQNKTGEVHICSKYVSRGYYHNKQLTVQKFEFLSPEKIMYKTGDLGYVNADGELVITGRIDHQIKISGKRIQPEEIESKILLIPNVEGAAVVKLQSANAHYPMICACIKSNEIDMKQIKAQLEISLPEFMIPKLFFKLEEFPLTANRKLDRKKIEEIAEKKYLESNQIIQEENQNGWSENRKKIFNLMYQCVDKALFHMIDEHTEIQQIFDSLGYIKYLVLIEEEFNFEFDDFQLEMGYVNTVQDFLDFTEKLLINKEK